MAAGYVTKTVGDGNGGTFSARFWSSDGTTSGLLYPAPVITDSAGAVVDFSAPSAVTQSGTWTVQPGNTPNTTPWVVDADNFPTTVDTNSGNKSASTIRVVLATDQPALTTPMPTTVGATALTDASSTITAGGTAQTLFSAASVVSGYEVINPDPTADLWISDTTTAAANGTGSIRIVANGGSYSSPAGMKPSAAVSIVGATTGQKFTARRW